MVNAQMLQGNWNEIKGKIKERWGSLTDDELLSFSGDVDQLVGRIQARSGESREDIERFLDDVTSGSASMMGRASETVRQASDTARQYAQQASSSVQQASRQAAESMREGYAQAGRMVRQYPTESLAVALGAGLITGVVLGMLLRSR